MTWLLARQHRAFGLGVVIALGLFAVAAVWTGIHMADVYDAAKQCHDGRCLVVGRLFSGYGAIVDAVHLTIAVPVVFAVFGASVLARETDAGTNVLVWMQTVSRRRWLVTKLLAASAAAVVVAGAVSGLVTWWSATPNALDGNRFEGAQFDTQNVVPVATALLGVAIGLAAGAWLRRVVPAIAASIVVFVAVRAVTAVYLRPHYMAPVSRLVAPDADARLPSGSWTLTRRLLDPGGHVVPDGRVALPSGCRASASRDAFRCLARVGYRDQVRFHPASHYWQFQWTEVAVFVALAALLLGVAYVLVRRRDA
jgi:hypothetical protein